MSSILGLTSLLLAQSSGGQAAAPTDLNFVFLIGFMVVFFWLFIIGPQRREAAEKQKLLSSLKKNDKVLTTGGFYGTITNLKDDEVTLRIDDRNKVTMRVVKSAIAKVLGTEAGEPAPDEEGKKS